ncbi:hypothetical protein DOE63_06035 [Salmonella enterica subsp. diarizonae serovar 59:z10:-]|nr:hypothetical protein DOE63_06035 [Salmonella enterica subsp. diarizonae serovar 59:z10:-]
MSRKHVAVTEETKMRIERIALEVSNKTGKITKWSEIVHYLIENYLEDARQDLLNQRPQKRLKTLNIRGEILIKFEELP